MCGYFNDSMLSAVSENDLRSQFDKAMNMYKGEEFIKVFTSGSFLDPSEIPTSLQREILLKLSEHAKKVSVESRPQYITQKTIAEIEKIVQPKTFEIGIGLETSNDFIRETAINKGFTLREYVRAALVLKKHHMSVKTYLLMKPPFLTEKEAIDDCIRTLQDTAAYTDVISLNPTNIQRHTLVEYLWRRNQYRPPWLWSIIEFLKHSKSATDALVKCDVVGGGSIRGAHNCGLCDKAVLSAIEQFSLTQKQSTLKGLSCSCQEQWRDQLNLESLSFGSIPDFLRWNP